MIHNIFIDVIGVNVPNVLQQDHPEFIIIKVESEADIHFAVSRATPPPPPPPIPEVIVIDDENGKNHEDDDEE